MSAADGDPGQNPLPPEGWHVNPAGLPQPTPVPGTNRLAIASLLSSIAGLAPYFGGMLAVAGIVLGTLALGQIRRAPQAGYGLAVAGIVLGVATLVIGLIWTIYAMR